MSFIESNITIDLPDGVDPETYVQQIRAILEQFNGKDTHINVVEVDDAVSTNPIHFAKR